MQKGIIAVILAIVFGILSLIFLASTIFLYKQNTGLDNNFGIFQLVSPSPTPKGVYNKDAPATVDCSIVKDDICPQWCAAGSDYDCCIRTNHKWIEGRGCYDK